MGMDAMPNMQPNPWAAPAGPSRSKAIGPSKQMKHPSEIPIIRVSTTNIQKCLASGMQAVTMPSTTNAICCMRIRLICGKSAILPNMSRLTPDVAPIHMTRASLLTPGITRLVCFT